MKKLLFIAACVAALVSCNKQVEQKPFDVRDIDSITVKDGADNPVKLSVLLDSTYNDLFKSEKEVNDFFERVVWNLKTQCNHPRTFVPNYVGFLHFKDTIEYKDINIYNFQVLVQGVAKNSYGVEGDVSDILNLIAWRDVTHLEATEDEPAEDWVYWHVMPNDKFFMDSFKSDIDKKLAEQQ